MWNKRTDEPNTVRPEGEPAPGLPQTTGAPAAAAATAATVATVSGPHQPAVIGASMTIIGDIRARQELRVDGEVEGVLESQSLLTVGPNGKVRGNIKAREVAIFGSVRGNVEVTEKIAIRDQGSLIGDIKGAGIRIDDGAYFKGNVDIVRAANAEHRVDRAIPAPVPEIAADRPA